MTSHTYCKQCVALLAIGVATTGHTLTRFKKRASLVVGPRGPGRWAVLALSSGICTVVEKPRIATSRTDTRESNLVDRHCRQVFERAGVADFSISAAD